MSDVCYSFGSCDCKGNTDSLCYLMDRLATNQQRNGQWDKSYKDWRIRGYFDDLHAKGIKTVSDLEAMDGIPEDLLWNDVVVADIAKFLSKEVVVAGDESEDDESSDDESEVVNEEVKEVVKKD
jgi:hypothetical protein